MSETGCLRFVTNQIQPLSPLTFPACKSRLIGAGQLRRLDKVRGTHTLLVMKYMVSIFAPHTLRDIRAAG